MVADNIDKTPEPTSDQILETLFLPENLHNLREQHARYAKIQEAKGLTDEIGVVGYLNMIMLMGLGVSAMKLITFENELGI